MAIKRITIGPRSRVLDAQEAAQRAADDQALLDAGVPEHVVYPPTPGPANPSIRCCGCGKVNVTAGDVDVDGVTHRYSAACFSTNEKGVRIYYDFTAQPTVGARLAALETVVADLVRRVGGSP